MHLCLKHPIPFHCFYKMLAPPNSNRSRKLRCGRLAQTVSFIAQYITLDVKLTPCARRLELIFSMGFEGAGGSKAQFSAHVPFYTSHNQPCYRYPMWVTYRDCRKLDKQDRPGWWKVSMLSFIWEWKEKKLTVLKFSCHRQWRKEREQSGIRLTDLNVRRVHRIHSEHKDHWVCRHMHRGGWCEGAIRRSSAVR